MRNGKPLGFMLAAALLLGGAGCGGAEKDKADGKGDAEKKDSNSSEKKAGGDGTSGSAVQDASLSMALAEWGRKHNHPAALAVAGEILAAAQETRMKDPKVESKPGEGIDSPPKTPANSDAAALREEAIKAAAGDAGALAAIQAIGKMGVKAKGEVRGPQIDVRVIRAGETLTYTNYFNANELAEVGVVGDGDTDLDLYIYDENWGLIDSDTGPSDRCYCSWVPRWQGKFYLVLKNLGRVANAYKLLTN